MNAKSGSMAVITVMSKMETSCHVPLNSVKK